MTIEDQFRRLSDQGFKDVTLLGQNVNSYLDESERGTMHENSDGFTELYKLRGGDGARFADLLDSLSLINPEMRI